LESSLLLLLLLLLGESLLEILLGVGGESLGLGHLSREEMGGEGINLTILVFITGESFEGNLFTGQLGGGNKSGTGLEGRGRLLLLLLGEECGS